MPFLFGRAYRRLGKNYFLLYVAFEFVSAFIVCLATVGLFALYTDLSGSRFWTIAAFAEVCVALSTAFMLWNGAKRVRPIINWIEGHGDALEAWHAAVEVPRQLTVRVGWQPFLLIGVPVSIFATVEAGLEPYGAFIIFAGTAVAVAYAAVAASSCPGGLRGVASAASPRPTELFKTGTAYSRSPMASRASPRSRYPSPRTILPFRSVHK